MQEQILGSNSFQQWFECLFISFGIIGWDEPARTSFISPGGASLMNSAAAESFWAFEAIP
jgi:hypothetical protein